MDGIRRKRQVLTYLLVGNNAEPLNWQSSESAVAWAPPTWNKMGPPSLGHDPTFTSQQLLPGPSSPVRCAQRLCQICVPHKAGNNIHFCSLLSGQALAQHLGWSGCFINIRWMNVHWINECMSTLTPHLSFDPALKSFCQCLSPEPCRLAWGRWENSGARKGTSPSLLGLPAALPVLDIFPGSWLWPSSLPWTSQRPASYPETSFSLVQLSSSPNRKHALSSAGI